MSAVELPDVLADATVLGPGEHLIIRLPDKTTFEDAQRFRDALKVRLPDVSLVIIVGAEVHVVRNEER